MIGRRSVLAGGMAALAAPVFGQTRPKPRPARTDGAGAVADLIAVARLGGDVGYVVADMATGKILNGYGADTPMQPASVTKAVTALFAAERLGLETRFVTRLLARGNIQSGTVHGDLILAGGGDPGFDTDRLGDMAAALAKAGVRRVSGQFLVWDGALPLIDRIDADQPDHVGYNPTISGVMLNFNRAQFVWGNQGGKSVLGMNAEGKRFNPPVHAISVVPDRREAPLFQYEASTPREKWSVAAPALNKAGSRWLPVRAPAAYIGDVFVTLCAAHGIQLPAAKGIATLPGDVQILVQDRSEPLRDMMRGMLRYSTNLTAESIGLACTNTASLQASAAQMSDWARAKFGTSARFVDHSGLGAASRCSPMDMVRIVQRAQGLGAQGLAALLRERRLDATGREDKNGALRVLAKSGTLNFTSNLAGYVSGSSGRSLAFAIFAGDAARRAALPMDQREDPQGGAAWTKRARTMQRHMIAAWANSYT